MSLFWLYKLHPFLSKIIQILSLNKSRAEKVSDIGMKNVYSFKSLSDAKESCVIYLIHHIRDEHYQSVFLVILTFVTGFSVIVAKPTSHVPIVSTFETSIFSMETIVLTSVIILELISRAILTLLTYSSAIWSMLHYSTSSGTSEIVSSVCK